MKVVITGVDDAGKSTVAEIHEAPEAVDAWKARLTDIPDWIVGTEKFMSFEPDPGWVKSFAVRIPPVSEEYLPPDGYDADNGEARMLHDARTAGMHKTLTCEVVFPFDPLVLILETGEVELEAGDMVVVLGVMHDWRNPNSHDARLSGVVWAVRP